MLVETGSYSIYKDRRNPTCPVMAEPVKIDGSDKCPVLAEEHVGKGLAGIVYIRIEGTRPVLSWRNLSNLTVLTSVLSWRKNMLV